MASKSAGAVHRQRDRHGGRGEIRRRDGFPQRWLRRADANQSGAERRRRCLLRVRQRARARTRSSRITEPVASPLCPSAKTVAVKPASAVVQHTGSGPHATRQTHAHAHSIRAMPGQPVRARGGSRRRPALRVSLRSIDGHPAAAPAPVGRGFARSRAAPLRRAPVGGRRVPDQRAQLDHHVVRLGWRGGHAPEAGRGVDASRRLHRGRTQQRGGDRPPDRPLRLRLQPREQARIAAFRVGADRRLHTNWRVTHRREDAARHFAIDPSGAFLIAANQESDTIALFQIDTETGALADTGARARVPSQVYVGMRPDR